MSQKIAWDGWSWQKQLKQLYSFYFLKSNSVWRLKFFVFLVKFKQHIDASETIEKNLFFLFEYLQGRVV